MHDHDLLTSADNPQGYPWADIFSDECDWCGKFSCLCDADPDGDYEAALDDDTDDSFFELCDENGVHW